MSFISKPIKADQMIPLLTPRIGEEAAGYFWRYLMFLLAAQLCQIVFPLLAIVGIRNNILPLAALGALLGVLDIASLVVAALQYRACNRVAGKTLGLKMGFRHIPLPSLRAESYERWCHKHGLVPYAAGGSAQSGNRVTDASPPSDKAPMLP